MEWHFFPRKHVQRQGEGKNGKRTSLADVEEKEKSEVAGAGYKKRATITEKNKREGARGLLLSDFEEPDEEKTKRTTYTGEVPARCRVQSGTKSLGSAK